MMDRGTGASSTMSMLIEQPPATSKLVEKMGGSGRVSSALLLRRGVVTGRQWQWYDQLIP